MSRGRVTPGWPFVAMACWLAPGMGYWLLGQRWRATTICIVVLLVFVMGLLIGGVGVVDAPESASQISQKPWFVMQVFTGPACVAAAWSAAHTTVRSHARSFEIGVLYTAIAGMLNLLAAIDASWRAAREEAA